MQRVRMCLPWYRKFGWQAEIICVDEKFVEGYREELLLKTIPGDVKVHKVKAFNANSTRKFGLGSLSMRSYFQIRKKGSELLKAGKFDLVFFSTTAFHVCHLGVYWKKKFNIPFVIDMQDPWRNDFYLDKPKSQRPKKFFISYNIDKYLEAATMPVCDGIISVSQGYIETLSSRYPELRKRPSLVLPFPFSFSDMNVAEKVPVKSLPVLGTSRFNFLYVGRGGHDLAFALKILFRSLKEGTGVNPGFKNIHFHFIGTSYAPAGKGGYTIRPVAEEFGVQDQVTEIPSRIGYFETLALLKRADALFVPGSVDTHYTASKIYPYIQAGKPLLAIFHENSSVVKVIHETRAGSVITFNNNSEEEKLVKLCSDEILKIMNNDQPRSFDMNVFNKYSAEENARQQAEFFDKVVPAYASV